MNDFVRLGHFKVKALCLTPCNIHNIGADGDCGWTTRDMGNYDRRKKSLLPIVTGMTLDWYGGEGRRRYGEIANIYY